MARTKDLGPEDVAELDEEEMPRVERPSLRSPGTGGDPEHKRRSDESNDLTT